ncbi:hypothetical protein THAOC_27410 [Thalassiosira oceanica]|uniref:Uncharacterized protein n=1 Tax=Thalassiosira oceanica TaxID=159749 RepID=K0RWM9_THAOC|nr:hypothetical protein THAOC_27410 [Thalassiosira oceanica]|eukprot:EJK53206.1 hypothetical protein THAOC_27410 [Thalassiosira oceanica]
MASATTPPPSPPGSRRLLGLLLNTPEEATVHAVAVRDASSMSIFCSLVGLFRSLVRMRARKRRTARHPRLADKGSVSPSALAATGGFLFGLSGATPGSPGPLRLGGCGVSEARRRRYRRLAGVEAEDWSPSASGSVAAA